MEPMRNNTIHGNAIQEGMLSNIRSQNNNDKVQGNYRNIKWQEMQNMWRKRLNTGTHICRMYYKGINGR